MDNQKKVDSMGFDDSEWNRIMQLLDDPKISDAEKELIFESYKKSLYEKMGVKV
ncbi:hypothetical protein [Methanobrevibacter ruminantium]|uniref:hypothetical protein n=1 Tax=Methanobrevibacter ruminantium TaxID=83816 RepID=UPI000ABA0051|nr:hypothetical protein [Methanobrevibacter ruminantium]